MATWTKRVLVGVVLVAMVAGLTPAASAMPAPKPGKAPIAAPKPEAFVPGPVNRTPVGGPIPEEVNDDGLASSSLDGIVTPGEVVGLRTEDSTTVVTEDGSYETTFFDAPVNYRDGSGKLVPIDSTLVPAGKPGAALRNAAGPVALDLPTAVGKGPVKASKGDTSVAFTLRGAKGAPTPGVSKKLTAKAREKVSEKAVKASATYAEAMPGVDVSYTATPEGVKEDIVLAGPTSPTTFDFTVEASKGLTATETPAGGIDFVDKAGEAKASFAPPFAYDAAFESTGAESSFTDDAVSLRIVETTPSLVVRLEAEEAWLQAPGRAWPVVIDPVLVIGGSDADTYLLKSFPDSNYNSSSRLYVSGGSYVRRAIQAKNIAAFFDEPATLYSATFQLYATSDTSAQAAAPVGLHEMATREWNSAAATWNTRLSPGLRWANPGGDFVAQPLFVNPDATGAVGWRSWPMTSLAQKWLDGTPHSGVMIKYENEASGALLSFASTNEADTSRRPRIVVNWEPLEGVRSPYSFEELDLGAAGAASVNVASGNLTLADTDLAIAGTGPAATVGRTYQSRGIYMGSVGARWRMWPQSEERLYYADGNGLFNGYARNGDVMWHGGPEELLVFSKRADGAYTSPPGYRGSLALTSEAGQAVFKLTDHASGTVRTFRGAGQIRDITDRNGNVITFGYTCDTIECHMVSMTDTQGRVTTFTRAAAGQAGQYKVTTVVDPAGRTHRYAYDRADEQANLASYTDPAGKVTRYEYTGAVLGLLSKVTDPNGNATTFAYDSRSRVTSLTRVADPATGAGPTWRFDYSTPWQTKVTDANGKVTTHFFDRQGRVNRVVDALGHQQASTYDSSSNVIDRTGATGNISRANFDANANLIGTETPTGASTALSYTDPSLKYSPTSMTNPQNNTWNLDYDPRGNLETVTDPMSTPGVSRLTYNANGTVATSTDAKGAVSTNEYDPKGNLTRINPPAPLGATTIAYDGLSRPTTVTDGKGQVTTTSYDALDRPIQTSVAGGPTLTYAYDAGGRLTQRGDATGTTTYAYDRLNRLVQEQIPGGASNAYTYDGMGNLTSTTDAGGTISYGYNDVNLVDELVEPGGLVTTFEYYDDNNRKRTSYPNGVTETATYDASGRVKTVQGSRGTSTLTSFEYDYLLSGADTSVRQSVTDKDGNTTTYGYDALDRLTSAVTKDSYGAVTDEHAYAYDAVGNRTGEVVNGLNVAASFNAADQLTSRAGVTYSYDANGNQVGSSAGQALVYNGADQTTSLTSAGGTALTASYAGGSQIERTTSGSSTFTNTLLGVSAVGNGGLTAYTRDPAGGLVGIRGTSASYYLFDGLGSVVAVTDATGAVTNSYTYDPYGVTTETKSSGTDVFNPWRYTGQYQDSATGLYKIGARYYQPDLGRWTQTDPSGLDAHPYAYAASNPVNNSDPTGLFCVTGKNPNGSCRSIARGIQRAFSAFDFGTYVSDCLNSAGTGFAAGLVLGPKGAAGGALGGCLQGVAARFLKDAGIRKDVVDNVSLAADIIGLDVNIVRASLRRVLKDYR